MTQEINKAFHLAAGKCIHKWEVDKYWRSRGVTVFYCKCGASYEQGVPKPTIPDYCDDPRLVIEAMRELKRWDGFFYDTITAYTNAYLLDLIMDRTGKLAKLGTEWIKQKGESDG